MPKNIKNSGATLTAQDEKDIVRNIRNGDPYAFRTLFKRYYLPLVQYARRYIRDRQTAEDIVSDVYLKIWEKRNELNIHDSIKAYMYKMTRNYSLNYLKRNKLESTETWQLKLSAQHVTFADEQLHLDEMEKHIEKAINALPDRTREVFTMHRYDNLKYSEIAEVLNIKEGTVETHMVRALKFLRKRLAFLLSIIPMIAKI